MDEERSTLITIGGIEYEMLLTTRAIKEISKRYGGIENLGDQLLKAENLEMGLDVIIWLITLLCNQSIMIENLKNKDRQRELLSEEYVELLTVPADLVKAKELIVTTLTKGLKRNIESEPPEKNTQVE